MSFLRNIITSRKRSNEETQKKDAEVKQTLTQAHKAQQEAAKKISVIQEQQAANKIGVTQEEAEEMVRQNSLNPFI